MIDDVVSLDWGFLTTALHIHALFPFTIVTIFTMVTIFAIVNIAMHWLVTIVIITRKHVEGRTDEKGVEVGYNVTMLPKRIR